jgi:hypothetical protein
MGAVTSTALDLITGALRNINQYAAGEPLDATDAADALQVMNDLLDSLSTDKLFVYTANESILAWTPGQFQYSIGNPEASEAFGAYTVAGSNSLCGITASLDIAFGLNAEGTQVGGTLSDTLGLIPSGTTIVAFNQGSTSAITFTASPTGTTATLNASWSGTSGTYLVTFSDNETIPTAFVNGSTGVTFAQTIAGTPTANAQVNTTILTMSANAIATTIAADLISYTVPGNFAIARPLRVRSGFTRITASGNTGLDYWWDVCNIDDYNQIGYKGVPGPWPYLLCYQPTYPYGTIWVYPNPQTAGQVYLWTDVILSQFTELNQTIQLPQGYARAFKKLLALELCPEYGVTPSAELLRQTKEARTFIKNLNSTPVKKLRYDTALTFANGRDASFIFHGGFGSNL